MSKHVGQLSGWGRLFVPGHERRSEDLEQLTRGAVLTRGLGRSYGDSSLPPPSAREVVASPLADRMLTFDAEAGRLRAEAGLSLYAINRVFWPRGWCSPVLPGTQYITLGGMVAADVHGKNHHCDGSFGEHVHKLRMRLADDRIVECSRETNADLFRATVGGMGLTGHILEVDLGLKRIPTPWIWQESRRVKNIDEFIVGLKEAADHWPYTVGWIDCLTRGERMGRGILYCGRWATPEEAPARLPAPKKRVGVPIEFPSWSLNAWTVRAFNAGFYWKHWRHEGRGIVHPESFFHPLDAVLHWNRIYGRRGFSQYQCVLPEAAGNGAARRFLELLTRHGGASFLCVIKDCGPEGLGLLSFPTRGISIALDVAVRNGTQALIDTLNDEVIAQGGRIYLAKDAFTRGEHFRSMEPRLAEWSKIREAWDPERRIRSAQSVRLFGDPL